MTTDTPTLPRVEIETVAVKIEIRDFTGSDRPPEIKEPGFYFWYEWPDPVDDEVSLFGPHATHEEAQEAAQDHLAEAFGDSAALNALAEAGFVDEETI